MSTRSPSITAVSPTMPPFGIRYRARMVRVAPLMALVGLATAPSLADDRADLDKRHQEVVKMSQLERDKLQRNLAEFQKLTEEQKQHYRDLARQIEDKSNGSSLSNVLQEYSAWLTTLTPSQRDELHKETDATKKFALVKRFKEEQEYRPTESPAEYVPVVDLKESRRPGPFFGPFFNQQDLNKVMKVITDDLPVDARDRIEKSTGLARYRDILKASIASSEEPRNWPSPDLQTKILRALEGSEYRDLFKKRPEANREMMVRMMLAGIRHLIAQEMPRLPNDNDKKDIFNQLNKDQQNELLRKSPEEIDQELFRRYREQQGGDAWRRFEEMQWQMNQLMNQLGIPRPQPGSGPRPFPFERPPGPNRPRDGAGNGAEDGRPRDRARPPNGPERSDRRPND